MRYRHEVVILSPPFDGPRTVEEWVNEKAGDNWRLVTMWQSNTYLHAIFEEVLDAERAQLTFHGAIGWGQEQHPTDRPEA